MSRFIVYKDPKKNKRQLLFAWITIGVGFLGLVFLFLYKEKRIAARVILPIWLLWSGFERLMKIRREYFLEINDRQLYWYLREFNPRQTVLWDDVRWIKQEKDGTISFYMASSFRAGFHPGIFTQAEQEQVLNEITGIAMEKHLELVNFSQPVLPTA
jgi:hypothetical protein